LRSNWGYVGLCCIRCGWWWCGKYVFQKSMLECVTRIQFCNVIISDWGLESNQVEMKRQFVQIMWYTSLGHWVIECDNWDVHDKTIGTSSDPTSYDVLVVTTSNGEVHKGVNNNSNLTTTILANLWFGSMQLSTIHNVN